MPNFQPINQPFSTVSPSSLPSQEGTTTFHQSLLSVEKNAKITGNGTGNIILYNKYMPLSYIHKMNPFHE